MATIRKRGNKWQVQIRRQGFAPVSRSFEQLRDAERWATLQERELDRMESQGVTGSLPCELTLAQLLERYRIEVASRKRGAAREGYTLDAFSRRPLARRRADGVTTDEFRKYRDERLRTVSVATVVRELGLIQHAYTVARRDWGFSSLANPLAEVTRPKLPRGRTRRLSAEEEASLRRAAATSRNVQLLPIMTLALETSMRLGEIVSLRWENVSLNHRVATLPMTKNGKERTVPLSQAAMAVLANLGPAPQGAVFATSTEAIKRAWIRLCRRASVVNFRFHDLRHEAISRLVERGFDLPEVMMFSGHTDHRMLLRYTHLNARKLVAKLDAV